MPNLLQAGLIRSLGAAATAARTNPSRDARPSGNFSSYLEAVRGGDRADRRDGADRTHSARSSDATNESRSEKPRDERNETQDAQGADTVADATEQAQVVVAANTTPIVIVTAAPVVKTEGETSADAGGSPETTAVANGANRSTADADATSAGAKGGDARAVVEGEQPPSGEQVVAARHSDNRVDASRQTPVSEESAAVQGQRRTEDVSSVVSTEDDDAGAVAADAEGRWSDKSAGKTTASTSALQDRTGDSKNAAAEDAKAAEDSADRVADRSPRNGNDGESARDVRVRDALHRALNGGRHDAGGQHEAPQGDSNSTNGGNRRPFPVASDVKTVDKLNPATTDRTNRPNSTSELPASASILAADGDGVAAAIGRFLVTAGEVGGRRSAARSEESGSAATVKPLDAGAAKTTTSPLLGMTDAASKASSNIGIGGTVAGRTAGTSTFSQILASRLDPSQSLEPTARVLSAAGSPNKWDVTLRLDPPELGSLRLVVRMEEGAMNLRVDADSRSAGRLIESRLGDLRDALAAHGIAVERMQVVVKPDPGAQADTQQRHPSQDDAPANRHARQDPTGEFAGQSDGGQAWDGGRGGRPNGEGAAWDGSAWAGWSGAGDSIAVESARADVTPTSETSVNLVA